MMKIFIAIAICFFLMGCANIPLKDGGLYLNEKTSVGMNDFGVAKVKSQF